jgi:hypothetical protein
MTNKEFDELATAEAQPRPIWGVDEDTVGMGHVHAYNIYIIEGRTECMEPGRMRYILNKMDNGKYSPAQRIRIRERLAEL